MIKELIDPQLFNDFSNKIKDQTYPNIHSLLIAKNGILFMKNISQAEIRISGKT